MAIPRQSDHRPALLACLANLVVRKGPFVQGPFYPTRDCNREQLFLVMFNGVECGTRVLRDIGREHSRFHGTFFPLHNVSDTDQLAFSAIRKE